MSNFLEQLGFRKKVHVGISLSANNFIELVCVDKNTKTITKYASGNIKYNNAIREIIDYDEFTEVLEGLFDEAGLNPEECAVTLNLPNIHFGLTTLENESEAPYIIENLQSEIEDLYIFKRNEPVISYSKLENSKNRNQKNIFFGAAQTKVIVKLIEIFDSMHCELVRIDTAYSSLLKAIQFCDRFNKYVQKEEKTSILLVTPNSCCCFYLEGNVIVDYIEEPLAVKSFSTEEVYATISKIAYNGIEKNNPNSILVISETDEINAETFASDLKFEGEVDTINKSINLSEQFIDVTASGDDIDSNMISFITIEAVGSAVSDYDEYPLNINFLPLERIKTNIVQVGSYEIELTRFAIIMLVFSVLLAVLITLITNFILENNINRRSEENSKIKNRTTVFQKRLEETKTTENKNIFPALKQVIDNNNNVINVFNALSTDIPDNIYIRRFVSNDEGGIGMIGEAKSSESVNTFVKGLREKSPELTLSKLAINTKYDLIPAKIPNGYTFEIKTQNHDVVLSTENEEMQPSAYDNTMNNMNNMNNNPAPVQNNSNNNLLPPPPVI